MIDLGAASNKIRISGGGMLKTIRKFVLERRRQVRRCPQQVLEDSDGASNHSELPLQREEDNDDL
jgi:hypothetical protein